MNLAVMIEGHGQELNKRFISRFKAAQIFLIGDLSGMVQTVGKTI